MIRTILDTDTGTVWLGTVTRKLPRDILVVARRKLRMLNNARRVEELRIPPANGLEKLSGNREGQWSIRINDQCRICFEWRDGNADRVQICDYL